MLNGLNENILLPPLKWLIWGPSKGLGAFCKFFIGISRTSCLFSCYYSKNGLSSSFESLLLVDGSGTKFNSMIGVYTTFNSIFCSFGFGFLRVSMTTRCDDCTGLSFFGIIVGWIYLLGSTKGLITSWGNADSTFGAVLVSNLSSEWFNLRCPTTDAGAVACFTDF